MSAQASVIISQDLSGVGQVSMAVALPLLAAMGNNCAVLPTALLSTHTGFADNTYLDLSAQMPAILAHWQKLALHPQGLLLGYLGAPALAVWQTWLPRYQTAAVRVIDPVMGDNGQLYRGFDENYVAAMRTLVAQATVITPNPTEAQLLLGEPLQQVAWNEAGAKALAARVAERFAIDVVVTGVSLAHGSVGVVGCTGGTPWLVRHRRLAGHYFGTGDIFASVLCGGLLAGREVRAAADTAATFVTKAILTTLATQRDPRFGVDYAPAIPWLLEQAD